MSCCANFGQSWRMRATDKHQGLTFQSSSFGTWEEKRKKKRKGERRGRVSFRSKFGSKFAKEASSKECTRCVYRSGEGRGTRWKTTPGHERGEHSVRERNENEIEKSWAEERGSKINERKKFEASKHRESSLGERWRRSLIDNRDGWWPTDSANTGLMDC